MSNMYEGIVQDLIDELAKLPGVGPKGATRIAFHLLATDSADVTRLATVLAEVKDKIKFCRTCYNVAQDDLCRICAFGFRNCSDCDLGSSARAIESKDAVHNW